MSGLVKWSGVTGVGAVLGLIGAVLTSRVRGSGHFGAMVGAGAALYVLGVYVGTKIRGL